MNNDKPFIEKFKGKFKDIDGGCTTLYTKTIQSIRNPDNLAVYIYLSSKPENWKVNAKDIQKHFNIGKNKVYKILKDLISIGVIEKKEIRRQGKFIEHQYFLYLDNKSPLPEIREMESPLPHLPVPCLPLPENSDTYKEEMCIKNIEVKKDFFYQKYVDKRSGKHYMTYDQWLSNGSPK